ncbi:MAG TPA: BamA/TamA family outer membrane protein [Polyangiales bacterium]|nr:BamA/TamA family outer membrane protein [Polyangiales bacterium]
MQRPRLARVHARAVGAALMLASIAGCAATIPSGRLGVDKLELQGVEDLDPYALRACLATKEREWFSVDLSRDPAPTCGKPPFDARRIHLPIWRWGWTDWPLYDPSVFERDLARIERWYRARGYYGVRILSTRSSPAEALYGDASKTDRIALTVAVEENQPVLVESVALEGAEGLEPSLAKEIAALVAELKVGARFDESDYDSTRGGLLRFLRDAGHASATVKGHVEIDPVARKAALRFVMTPGPLMELGDVCVEGFGKLPPRLILQASDLRPGRPFSERDIEDARTLIYQLRVLAEVEIAAGRIDPVTGASVFDDAGDDLHEGEWLAFEQGQAVEHKKEEEDQNSERVCRRHKGPVSGRPRVPIEIRVKPAQLYRVGVGAGVQIGVENGQRAINAAAQWDVHLVTYAEVRNFLGGLRRLRIEERPKLIFLAPFPRAQDENGDRDVRLGNNLSGTLEWPAFLEARTLLRLTAIWDRGPDPYGAKFIRDDFDIGLGPSRSFLKNRLNAAFAIHYNPYIPRSTFGNAAERANTAQLRDERYHLLFLQQVFEWDTRDDRNSPTKGTYGRLELHEGLPPSNWSYVRFTPEVRGYIPLPYGLVIASRVGIGLIHIISTDARTEELRRLGPRPYRLRGGGPYSVRGVQAGALGRRDVDTLYFPGGTRSWIASLELRVPLGDSLGIATFIDAGDVDAGNPGLKPSFRFDRPNTTIGAGVRYKTIVGPIRLDVGVLVPGLQGDQSGQREVNRRDPLFRFNGAVQLTIGEAF